MKIRLANVIQGTFLASTLFLTACSQLNSGAEVSSAKVASKVADNELARSLSQLEQQASQSPSFEYQYNTEKYVTYLDNQPVLINAYNGKEETKLFYRNGKLFAVQDVTGLYEFNSTGQLIRAVDLKGNLVDLTTLDEKAQSLQSYANNLSKRFAYNKADRNIARVAKEQRLNYLCIDKIKQVAQTNRVFRSSDNKAKSADRLLAELRLNGNQYYTMDCQLSQDRVAKLSLISR
ncbi:hypothetical protein EV694_0240 [Volucribacter psittacicida]|uniref:Lipoprotein n=1 Tax=Volucribacter psittacicida TaxID=203482 RepID=A0A4R1G536_9PAST|nr:hypothetical protein [Volucribacter psittacicida]TCK01623.1 hypothetical protein EV694_0240 [Volucribacter psittacicida]